MAAQTNYRSLSLMCVSLLIISYFASKCWVLTKDNNFLVQHLDTREIENENVQREMEDMKTQLEEAKKQLEQTKKEKEANVKELADAIKQKVTLDDEKKKAIEAGDKLKVGRSMLCPVSLSLIQLIQPRYFARVITLP